jgi:hypothetical protein
MSMVTANPDLKRIGVRAFSQHVGIMVAFQQQAITATVLFRDMGRDVSQVGEYA